MSSLPGNEQLSYPPPGDDLALVSLAQAYARHAPVLLDAVAAARHVAYQARHQAHRLPQRAWSMPVERHKAMQQPATHAAAYVSVWPR
jgi:hypothetical protein